ncbi:MAG: hypothetical protein FJ253_07835 [Phycisphaerae bacterium]|nr:hypothetical protein [Phycisphaerae bacterium]
MQNRFTFKDFVILGLLVIAVLIGAGALVSLERTFDVVKGIDRRVGELEQRVQSIASAPRAAGTAAPNSSAPSVAPSNTAASNTAAPSVAPSNTAASNATAAAGRDESWARPGVPVEWQPLAGFPSEPRGVPGFREGGEFVEVFEGQPKKVVPFLYADVYGLRVLDRVAEPLASYDPFTMKLRGVLADAWQRDPDGLWLRVHIDPRAAFSDGTPVTAADVKYTFMDFILNPSIDADRPRSIVADSIESVTVIDEHTAEFKFKQVLFSNVSNAMTYAILPAHYYSRFEPAQINQATGLLMGSGPFKMAVLPAGPGDLARQWAPPSDIPLVRNERWWAGRAALDSYRFKTIQSELPRLVEYKNGLVSMILPTAPQFNETLRDPRFLEENYALKWINMRSGYTFIAWQTGKRGETGRVPPFHDKRVRQAMTMLLDRERMIRDIWDGIGMVAKGPFNPEGPASNPAVEPWAYDPAKARELLKEAGWEDRNGDGVLENAAGEKFQFEFTYSAAGEIAERIGRFIKDAYTKAGIICETRPVDWSAYQSITKARDFDAIIMSWAASAPESDVKQMFHSESTAKGMDNWMQWRSAEADRIIDKARRTVNDEERMLIWQELEALLADEQPYTFVRVPPWLRFITREMGNVNTYRTGLVPDEFFRAESVLAPTN